MVKRAWRRILATDNEQAESQSNLAVRMDRKIPMSNFGRRRARGQDSVALSDRKRPLVTSLGVADSHQIHETAGQMVEGGDPPQLWRSYGTRHVIRSLSFVRILDKTSSLALSVS